MLCFEMYVWYAYAMNSWQHHPVRYAWWPVKARKCMSQNVYIFWMSMQLLATASVIWPVHELEYPWVVQLLPLVSIAGCILGMLNSGEISFLDLSVPVPDVSQVSILTEYLPMMAVWCTEQIKENFQHISTIFLNHFSKTSTICNVCFRSFSVIEIYLYQYIDFKNCVQYNVTF